MEQDDGGTSSSYIDPVTIHKWYIRRPWIYCTIPLHNCTGLAWLAWLATWLAGLPGLYQGRPIPWIPPSVVEYSNVSTSPKCKLRRCTTLYHLRPTLDNHLAPLG